MDAELAAAWSVAGVAMVAVWALHRRAGAARRVRLLLTGTGSERATAASGPGRGSEVRAVRVRAVLVAAYGRGKKRLERRLGARIGPEALCLPAGLLLALAARSPVPLLAGAVAVPCVGRRLRCREQRLACEAREEAVAGLCAALAGELRAGSPPELVLTEAVERLRGTDVAQGWAALTPLLAAARFGGDVPSALREAAGQLGAEGLAAVAVCWEVAVDGGAGLADGLDRVAASLRAERSQREDLRAQLAGPKVTAAMLALLPAFGVLLGVSLGADPLRVLFRTPVGFACLVVGAALEWAGLAWTARIVRTAEGVPS
ncbi:type II secretion system F family protein [Streptomyces sp. SL13]|uniref:Type II secretion system F family protein n=1 Tax=Streptantibioticus silvisoli TaxID=2705255 RepID=A0AA90GX72_9ACTN|nr:type II secretion system F family protein [Streptantibioticus silvisoli]MDI5969768.1 type II secretion system F family protein [Streptantibioticus silvisoli]